MMTTFANVVDHSNRRYTIGSMRDVDCLCDVCAKYHSECPVHGHVYPNKVTHLEPKHLAVPHDRAVDVSLRGLPEYVQSYLKGNGLAYGDMRQESKSPDLNLTQAWVKTAVWGDSRADTLEKLGAISTQVIAFDPCWPNQGVLPCPRCGISQYFDRDDYICVVCRAQA